MDLTYTHDLVGLHRLVAQCDVGVAGKRGKKRQRRVGVVTAQVFSKLRTPSGGMTSPARHGTRATAECGGGED